MEAFLFPKRDTVLDLGYRAAVGFLTWVIVCRMVNILLFSCSASPIHDSFAINITENQLCEKIFNSNFSLLFLLSTLGKKNEQFVRQEAIKRSQKANVTLGISALKFNYRFLTGKNYLVRCAKFWVIGWVVGLLGLLTPRGPLNFSFFNLVFMDANNALNKMCNKYKKNSRFFKCYYTKTNSFFKIEFQFLFSSTAIDWFLPFRLLRFRRCGWMKKVIIWLRKSANFFLQSNSRKNWLHTIHPSCTAPWKFVFSTFGQAEVGYQKYHN